MRQLTRQRMRGAARALACGLAVSYGLGWSGSVSARAQGAGDAGRQSGQQSGQDAGQGGRRGQYAGMGRLGGEVTAVAGNTLTLKGEDGHTAQVVVTDNTRVMKDRGPVRASDLHVGDGLMAFGNLDAGTRTLHAAVVMATDASQLKAMRENLGKTYITGRVTAINLDDARMTVERPDHVAQTIGFDESTSFKRAVRGERGSGEGEGRTGSGGMGSGGAGMGAMASGSAAIDRAFASGESITLADIKVGDTVTGTGGMKAGVFVPARLIESPPRQHAPHGAGANGAGANGAEGAGPSAQGGPAGPATR